MASSTKARPVVRPVVRPGERMRLVEALEYRLPLAARVSILHRASGLLLVALLPFVIWLFDKSVTSQGSYDLFASAFTAGVWVLPGVVVKLVVLALIWALMHHLCAGVRHLWMDATHAVSKEQGRASAMAVMVASLVLTVLLGLKLFGVF